MALRPRHLYICLVASTQAIRAWLVSIVAITPCSARAHTSNELISASGLALDYRATIDFVTILPTLLS